MTRTVLPSGESALLVECDDLDEVLGLHDALSVDQPDGVIELVPAARTILIAIDPRQLPLESAAHWVERAAVPGVETSSAAPVRISPGAASARRPSMSQPLDLTVVPVVYDGDDLAAAAATLGISVDELIARHTGVEWRVAFIGFAPGFGYLVSDDWTFDVPRLDAPRTRVPVGAVALAGAFTGAYPRSSPGGWQLIGRTDAALWNADAAEPAIFRPGRRVRFERVGS